jgi:hypothetical protein
MIEKATAPNAEAARAGREAARQRPTKTLSRTFIQESYSPSGE